MRKILTFLLLLTFCAPALAQDITNHSVAVGGGPGFIGFRAVGPCTNAQVLGWPSGVSADPACGNVPAGAIANNSITNAMLAQMPANTVKCNNTGSTANAADCINISLQGNPGLTTAPTGNPPSTLSSAVIQGNATSANGREFLINLGLTSAVGSGGTAGNDKVTLYSGLVANSGTANVWSVNTVLTMSAGSGSYTAQGYELDFNNLNANLGAADGATGLAAPAAYGLSITGASTFSSTAAMLISGNTNQWHRGIVLANASVQDSSFQDLVSSTISLDIRGSHTYGLDLRNGAFSGAPIRLGFGTGIVWRDSANSVDNVILTLSASATQQTAARLYNASTANNVTKTIALDFRGLDTVSTDKLAAQVIVVPGDSNWTNSDLVFNTQLNSVVSEVVRFSNKGYIKFSGTAPTLTAGCNGAGSVVSGNNVSGTITGQTTAATTCTLTFANSGFASAPNCVAMGQSSPLTGVATPGTTTLVVNFASTANYKWSYICPGL